MWTMWNAPSDHDYFEQFNPTMDEIEDPDNELPALQLVTARVKMANIPEWENDECPF